MYVSVTVANKCVRRTSGVALAALDLSWSCGDDDVGGELDGLGGDELS